jgi:hypothetical protein
VLQGISVISYPEVCVPPPHRLALEEALKGGGLTHTCTAKRDQASRPSAEE